MWVVMVVCVCSWLVGVGGSGVLKYAPNSAVLQPCGL